MKKAYKVFLTLICAFALSFAASPVHAADESVLLSGAEVKGDEVTFTLGADGTPVTNGRIGVTFNENELTLVSAVNGENYELEDLNVNMEADEEGNKTVYFAFASTEASDYEGVTVTLKFKAEPAAYNKDVTIQTKTEEMNNGSEAVELTQGETVVHIDKPVSDTKTPSTGDNSNMMLYIALLAGAVVIIGLVVYSKKKSKH